MTRRQGRALLAVILLLCGPTAMAWDSSRLRDPVVVNGHTIPYPVFAIFVMPGSRITVEFENGDAAGTVTFLGREAPVGEDGLRAPAGHGLRVLEIDNSRTGETARINVFTMIPAGRVAGNGRLNGYRIDAYPAQPLRGLAIYRPPTGFVEVTADNAATPLSPNFTLGQFVSKQESGYPKYVVLRAALLLKLEEVLTSLNAAGHAVSGFVIMSGYRTPFYNRAIGNVEYSRHVYGGAADIYIDQDPVDGEMDDLNGDGRVDRADAVWLADFVDGLSQDGLFGPRIGGLGVYDRTAAHGPFVHVDVRGFRARW